MADLATIYKMLRFAGIQLIAVHDGKADEIAIGVRGLLVPST
jgi:site-specific DNA recombinase